MKLELVMTVSDRAKALLKVSDSEYLGTYSMPDLFHLMQDLGKSVGARLGLRVSNAVKNISGQDYQSEDYDLLDQVLLESQAQLEEYTDKRESINQAVHPLNEWDKFTTAEELEKRLNHSYTEIRKLAKQSKINLTLQMGNKIINQIPDIANGVSHWLSWLKAKIEELDLSDQDRTWLEESLFPYVYWQVNQTKRTRKKKDKQLNEYYQRRLSSAKYRFENDPITREMNQVRKEKLVNWTFRKAATFQRASSQVEGRNGYLAFIHHAQKGIPKKRKKVLTVIHNFDIRRADGKTPANRLFKRDFPNLFEFVLDNMDELPKPRQRKRKYA